MNLRKKINFTVIPLVLCLILLISATYAWLTLSFAPEVTSVDTNIGANGSLEIALLSDETYVDPLTIRTTVGASAVRQDALQSNLFWGNVIELRDERYGISQISLLPSRLNLVATDSPYQYTVSDNMLKIAQFGKDGRISMLMGTTASAVFEDQAFTYHADHQRYGVRAIGTISNLSPQQLALASARTQAQSHTAAAVRAVKNVWREYGAGMMDVVFNGDGSYDQHHVAAVRGAALQLQEALDHIDLVTRQGIIGLAAAGIPEADRFEAVCKIVNNRSIPLSALLEAGEVPFPSYSKSYIKKLDTMKQKARSVITGCDALSDTVGWGDIQPLLRILADADRIYTEESRLSDAHVEELSDGDMITLSSVSGLLAEIAEFTGNYSTYFQWDRVGSLGVATALAAHEDTGSYLDTVLTMLESSKAAVGGWTKAELDDTYAMAIDMAFRCNVSSDLLLQTTPVLRSEETTEFSVTQGGGSYMRFTSAEMSTESLLKLMDTIRVGFLNDRNDLISVAKLGISQYEEHEEGIFAPLYLYEYSLQDTGALAIGQRRGEKDGILTLSQNVPAVVTVVVWLDGDYVDNSMVGHSTSQSMSGVLNLQFSSSVDLKPLNLPLKNGK